MLLNSFDLNFTQLKEAFAAPSVPQDMTHKPTQSWIQPHHAHVPHLTQNKVLLRQEGKQKAGETKPSADSSVYGILNIKY